MTESVHFEVVGDEALTEAAIESLARLLLETDLPTEAPMVTNVAEENNVQDESLRQTKAAKK